MRHVENNGVHEYHESVDPSDHQGHGSDIGPGIESKQQA
jgi:hypothetical protein